MRAPSSGRSRRRPIVDEVDNPNILPPLDRPFDSLLTTRSRLRTDDPLTRRLLGHAHAHYPPPPHHHHHNSGASSHHGNSVSSLALQSRTTRNSSRGGNKSACEDVSVPSLIRVEMLSCDGGSLDFDESGRYNAENLLLDNISVYCTAKLENVNILLRGAGSRPFTLSRIEIKAPQRSFTSPVKDGLIFVSMDRINACDTRIYDRQAEQELNEEEVESESIEEVGEEEELGFRDLGDAVSSTSFARRRQDFSTANLERLLAGHPLPGSTTDLHDTTLSKDILRPHAYFVVDERSGSATILFEPAVSGRYVHVKLLSGQPFDNYPGRFERDNIDIQAILLYGYGRRSFPTCQLR